MDIKCESLSHVWLFVAPWTLAIRLLCLWNSLGNNNGVGCHFPLQGIFLTQGSNPGLLHWRQILYQLSHQGSPNEHQSTTIMPCTWLVLIIVKDSFIKSHYFFKATLMGGLWSIISKSRIETLEVWGHPATHRHTHRHTHTHTHSHSLCWIGSSHEGL